MPNTKRQGRFARSKDKFRKVATEAETSDKNVETPENTEVKPKRQAVNKSEGSKAPNKANSRVKIAPPPDHKQKPLITLLREHLDVVNVYKLGKAMERVSQVRHFIERQRPFVEGKDWILFKAALSEEVRLMENFVKEYKRIKNTL